MPDLQPRERVQLNPTKRRHALGAQSIDPELHKLLTKAGEVWKQHRDEAKRQWSDWLDVLGPALQQAQCKAMQLAKCQEPKGQALQSAHVAPAQGPWAGY